MTTDVELRAMRCWAMRDDGATWRHVADWLVGPDLAWTDALTFAMTYGRRPYESASSPPASLHRDLPENLRNVRAEEGARLLAEGIPLPLVAVLLEYPSPGVAGLVIEAESRDRDTAHREAR